MFERYFGFTRTPFARDLKPSNLFDWSGAKEMRSRLARVSSMAELEDLLSTLPRRRS